MKVERTSSEIARLAGKVLGLNNEDLVAYALVHPEEIRAIAASALTQAPDTAPEVARSGGSDVAEPEEDA